MTRLILPLVLCTLSAPGWAQTTGSIGYLSDYQARGMSLSEGRAAAQATLNHDTAFGLYGGLSAAQARLPFTNANLLWTAYAGYAARLGNEGTWEVGTTRAMFRGAGEYDYSEVFVGAGWQRVSARIYYAPHYYGVQGRSLYAEVNGAVPLTDAIDLQLHAGRLRADGGGEYWYRDTGRTDVRVAVSFNVEAWTMYAAWTTVHGDRGLYGTVLDGRARAWSAGVAWHF